MIDFFISTYIGAFLQIIIGFVFIIHSLKKGDTAPSSPLQPYASGIIAGAGFIVLGIVIIINKLLGNW